MTFLLAYERSHRVLRAKAAGVVATQDLLDLEAELIGFLAREETSDQPAIRGLYDFSDVEAFAVPQTKAAERGNRPSILRGLRDVGDAGLVEIEHEPREAAAAGEAALLTRLRAVDGAI